MAPTVLGLHLGPPEMRWNKFASSYMFGNKDYHLRRTKFIVYQFALIFCVFSESLGTATLSDFVDQQRYAEKLIDQFGQHANSEYNDDYVAVGSYNIWAGVFCAFVFGAAFFFDLFWPERREDHGIKLAWKYCGLAACVFLTADVIALTIITSSRRAYIIGPNAAQIEQQLYNDGRYNLVYRHNKRAIAAVVFVWLGWASTLASEVVLWKSINYTDEHGPFSTWKCLEIEAAGGKVYGHARGGPGLDVYPERTELSQETKPGTENTSGDANRDAPLHDSNFQPRVGTAAAAEDLKRNRASA